MWEIDASSVATANCILLSLSTPSLCLLLASLVYIDQPIHVRCKGSSLLSVQPSQLAAPSLPYMDGGTVASQVALEHVSFSSAIFHSSFHSLFEKYCMYMVYY